jgi:hypothetical protein
MDPLYPVAGHALLSPAAARLGEAELNAQTLISERLLGLAGTSLTDDDALEAANANALQVSYQVAMPPEQAIVLTETRGARTVTYRGGTGAGLSFVYAQAQAIVDAILGEPSGSWGFAGPRR